MPRSVHKGPFVDFNLRKKLELAIAQKDKKPIKTYSRNSVIIPEFVGFTIAIHNGKVFTPIFINENMIGHKLGEFSPTRTFKGHTAADKKAAADKKGK